MLESRRDIAPVFFRAHFWILLIVNAILTVGINIGVDYGMNKNKSSPHNVVATSSIIEILIFSSIIASCVIWGSGDIHKKIRDHEIQPIARTTLCDTLIKRIVFFSIAEPDWKWRFPKFLVQVWIFPGFPVTLIVWTFCWMAKDFSAGACTGSLWDLCAWNAVWKCVITAIVFAINYVAAHNDAQPECQPKDDAKEESSLVGKQEQVDYDSAPVKTASNV